MKQAKSKKDKKSEETSSVAGDPLSSSVDPLSLSPASDPLSAALLDPLSQAAAEATTSARSFGAKPEKVWIFVHVISAPMMLVFHGNWFPYP